MKVGIPIWEDRLSPVFDTAARLAVFELGDGEPVRETELALSGQGLMSRLRVLRQAGVECLLCGAISQGWCRQLEAAGIRVMPFLTGDWRGLLAAYRDGRLTNRRYRMPGCRQRRCRRRRHVSRRSQEEES
jgi:predicted Fe-Mo cluster-binding NifX family protein